MSLVQSYAKTAGTPPSRVYRDTVRDILRLAQVKLQKPPAQMAVLDVGCAYGSYTFELSKKVKKVVGVEPFKKFYDLASKHKLKNTTIHYCKIENFDTTDRFDLVICLATVEHMPNAKSSFKRIYQLLRPGGIVYITAPNKLWFFDGHYQLPFILWMPLWMANVYVRFSRRGKSFKDASYSKTYFGMKKLLKKFRVEFIVPDPQASYLGLGLAGGFEGKVRNLGIKLLKRYPFMWVFSKGFIILAQKR